MVYEKRYLLFEERNISSVIRAQKISVNCCQDRNKAGISIFFRALSIRRVLSSRKWYLGVYGTVLGLLIIALPGLSICFICLSILRRRKVIHPTQVSNKLDNAITLATYAPKNPVTIAANNETPPIINDIKEIASIRFMLLLLLTPNECVTGPRVDTDAIRVMGPRHRKPTRAAPVHAELGVPHAPTPAPASGVNTTS